MKLIAISTYIALMFVPVAILLPDELATESLVFESIYRLGSMALLVHYVSMLWAMWKERHWSYVLGSLLFFFIPTFIYYFSVYSKPNVSA